MEYIHALRHLLREERLGTHSWGCFGWVIGSIAQRSLRYDDLGGLSGMVKRLDMNRRVGGSR